MGHGSDLAVIPTLAFATFTRSFSHSLSRSCFYLANERKEDCTRYVLKEETDIESRETETEAETEIETKRKR